MSALPSYAGNIEIRESSVSKTPIIRVRKFSAVGKKFPAIRSGFPAGRAQGIRHKPLQQLHKAICESPGRVATCKNPCNIPCGQGIAAGTV
jgi:hypothetical protein